MIDSAHCCCPGPRRLCVAIVERVSVRKVGIPSSARVANLPGLTRSGPVKPADFGGLRCLRPPLRLVGQQPLTARPATGTAHWGRWSLGRTIVAQHKPTIPSTDEVFRAFVGELAAGTVDLPARMKVGHEPDEHGWCRHTTHEHHWERHPCPVLRLAQLAEIDPEAPTR